MEIFDTVMPFCKFHNLNHCHWDRQLGIYSININLGNCSLLIVCCKIIWACNRLSAIGHFKTLFLRPNLRKNIQFWKFRARRWQLDKHTNWTHLYTEHSCVRECVSFYCSIWIYPWPEVLFQRGLEIFMTALPYIRLTYTLPNWKREGKLLHFLGQINVF